MPGNEILIWGREESFPAFVRELIGDLDCVLVPFRDPAELAEIKSKVKISAAVLDCPPGSEEHIQKVVAAVWLQFPKIPIAPVYTDEFNIDLVSGIAGFKHLTFLQRPFESEDLFDWIIQSVSIEIPTESITLRHLSPIRTSDFIPGEPLKADVYYYMANNKRILKYRQKAQVLSGEQIEKFKNGNINELFIRKGDRKAFNTYLLQRMKYNPEAQTQTADRDKVKDQVKDIFRGLFTCREMSRSDTYHAMVACKKVVGDLIHVTSAKPEIYQKILQLTGGMTSKYDHASNVSVFTTLLALVLGQENLDSAAIGGLLHDIGLASLPVRVDESQFAALSEREQNYVKEHPRGALRLLDSRKFTADPVVRDVILQHHEHYDGKGYPQNLKGEDIHPLARICAIANALDELTSLPGLRNPLSVLEAIEYLIHTNKSLELGNRFDHDYLLRIHKIFLNPNEAGQSAEALEKFIADRVRPPPTSGDPTDVKRARRVKSGMKF